MLTLEEVKQICGKVSMELTGAEEDSLWEDVSSIVYRLDTFDCVDMVICDRHIDIEYSFGDCYEIKEDAPLFQWICERCGLHPAGEETVLYQAESG